uniref:hypothetical protein n=1 Tax=Agathobacter sp. TaxID=2021311 RepID=UPI004056F57A
MVIETMQFGHRNHAVAAYTEKIMSAQENYQQILEKKREEQPKVIKNGGTDESFRFGAKSYTLKEWDELLENFDAVTEDMREQMRAEHQKRYEEQLQKIADMKKVYETISVSAENTEAVSFTTSNYEIVADNEYQMFHVYNKAGEKIGAFHYEDIKVRTDTATGTQLLISEHGTAAYSAMLLDKELIAGFQSAMQAESLEEQALEGFQIYTHAETGIRYIIKDGDEGRGGNLLISSEQDKRKLEQLAQTYLEAYPNLITDPKVAQSNAVLEVLGLLQRTPNGIVTINKDGMSYCDNANQEKNWSLLFQTESYETVISFMRLQKIMGMDVSDYTLWKEFFKGNGIEVERIWSDEELEQGYLNVG